MRRSRRPAASGETRRVDVVLICSSSDQEGQGSDSDDVEEEEDEEEQDVSDDEDYIDSDCDGVLEEDEKASSSEEDDEENAVVEKPNDEERCRKVVDLLRRKQSLDTLKLEECKSYLRSHGLRLSGTKSTCVSRILEHWRLKDGNGEILYPQSSFVINCTGDVCKGDVVLFRQRVYDKFTRTIIGKRTIAGRVVKESYGAVKQQHTFTVEVLWSRGKNAVPPMFPLLVKGRNLYRLKTFRQPWSNERERSKVLAEKHQRGAVARHIRKNSKAMSMNGGSRRHQGSSSDAKQLNGKKRRGEESRNISGRKKKKVASSLRKVPCENSSSQGHTDTVARNFDSSCNVPRQAINHGGSRHYQRSSSDANKQANWNRNVSSHNVPCATTSSSAAHSNAQDITARNFHPSYGNRRQEINHGGSTYQQRPPVSLRNPFYNHNTHLELQHPSAAPPQMNPGIGYVPTHRRDGSFGMTDAPHLPSNMRYQFHHPYASAASSVNTRTESQLWQRPGYDEHGRRIHPAIQSQRFRRP